MPSSELKIDWATHEAAKFAVEHWHYSQRLPFGAIVKVGAWEAGKFVGVVLFSRGANNHIGSPYGLEQTEVCELTRIALRQHQTPVSRIMSIAIKFLQRQSPGLRLIVSYADPSQGHHGGVYQANGWVYAGATKAQQQVIINGKEMHKRSADAKFGTIKGLQKGEMKWKHQYLMPLDKAMRERVEKFRQPYPKRVGSAASGTAIPVARDGATPISTLSPKVQL